MVRIITTFAVLAGFYFPHLVSAQSLSAVSLQTGVHAFMAEPADVKNIRANLGYSFGDERNAHIGSVLTSTYGGVSIEVSSDNDRFVYSSGVRYSRMTGTLSMKDLILFNTPYFFFRFRESGLITEYVSLRKIAQKTDFIGIPVEVRWFPFDGKRVRFFIKGAAEINYKVATGADIEFYEPAMAAYEKQVVAQLPEAADIHGVLSLSGGVRFGKPGSVLFAFEFAGPSAFLSPGSGGIVRPSVGTGGLFSIIIPVKR